MDKKPFTRMDQHPVPQNVTSFEFKLIGDMTLRQFGYLAAGFILGYLSFKFTLIPSLFRLPLGGFWVLFGIALAFFPLEGRPLDRWVTAFFSRVYQPTQYVWKKSATPPEILAALLTQPSQVATAKIQPSIQPRVDTTRLTDFIATLPTYPSTPYPPMRAAQQPSVVASTAHQEKPMIPRPVVQPPTQQPLEQSSKESEEKTKQLSSRIEKLQKELSNKTLSKERFMELQKELTSLITEKEALLQKLVEMRKNMDDKNQSGVVRPTEFATDQEPQQHTVKMVPQNLAQKKGIPYLTTVPNVVTGIVKTAEGEFLPNIMVTVKDKSEMPVRALKTNKLGQFASSSPLSNGIYHIEIEDLQKRFTFDVIEIALSGGVVPPLEISAKSKRDILRAQLHKELFGTQEL